MSGGVRAYVARDFVISSGSWTLYHRLWFRRYYYEQNEQQHLDL